MHPYVTHIKAVTDIQRSILKKSSQLTKINYWQFIGLPVFCTMGPDAS
jgi:hypothetical protein